MKLGNRKVVIGGLTAIAFTSLTAFTNVTPDTTSDTNPFSATTSVEYQSLALAGSSGIGKISSLFMPGRVTTTLDTIKLDSKSIGSKNPIKAQAGIANIFTQSVTLDALETVVTSNNDSQVVQTAAGSENQVVEQTTTSNENQVVEQTTTSNESIAQEEVQQSDSTNQESEAVVSDESNSQSNAVVDNTSKDPAVTTNESNNNEIKDNSNQTAEATNPVVGEAFSQGVDEQKKEEKSEWSDKVMANVDEAVNIRADANEEGEIVGKLYKGAEATILEKGDEWTKISSGSVSEGYVKNQFLAFDDEAKALAEKDGQLIATVNTNALRIRSDASDDAKILDLAENGEQLPAVEEEGDWVEIAYTKDSNAFVSSQFVTVDYVLGKAVTLEEDEAIKAEKKRKEAEARMAEIAASEDASLLAAVVRMEAGGESYEGKLAVASVVVNRMRSGRYPNSVSGVVYQSGQFPGAANGTLAGFLSAGIGGDCKKAAVEALAGLTNVTYLHFNSVSRIGSDGYVIGNHCFY